MTRSERAWEAFRARVTELGGSVIEPAWLGSRTGHRVICAVGHECTAHPATLQRGGGFCRKCAATDPPRSVRAWEAFQTHVFELGGSVIEPAWLGNNRPHRVICAAGHPCAPHPTTLQQGGGFCRTCAGTDPQVSESVFRSRIAELGGTVLEPAWLGVNRPHRVICAAGHECAPRPNHVQEGIGICRVCAKNDPHTAEVEFRTRVAELGGSVLEPSWLGAIRPHRVICPAGHETTVSPASVQQGRGLCRVCVGQDSETAEAEFRTRVAELGGTVLEPSWLGSGVGHRVRCPMGHETTPRPNHLKSGTGLCRICAGLAWDGFYIVTDDDRNRLKFGITSGDPRNRLDTHRYAGYRSVIRVLTGLPGDTARAIERRVLSTLKLAGEQPIHGREYFGAHVLTTVLDIVDHYPITIRKDQVSC